MNATRFTCIIFFTEENRNILKVLIHNILDLKVERIISHLLIITYNKNFISESEGIDILLIFKRIKTNVEVNNHCGSL